MLRKALVSVFVALTTTSSAFAITSPFPPGFLTKSSAPRPVYDDIPIESNSSVRKWINFFSQDDRNRFERFMIRGGRYRILVQEILEQNGVPPELYYLGMIESGYASRARSGARAVGIWQFMPATARRYGLRVNKDVDERLDVMRSTRAAARYLRDLKNEFGSWYMAMAAYNCGEGRVRRAVRRHRTLDYWTLARRRALPAETSDYVPKFQAAMKIARNPSAYGFGRITHYEFPEVRLVKIRAQLDIDEIARRHRVSAADLRALNPNLLRERTPRLASGYGVWVPKL
jgi:membrane-bound lytic murein transglycosylase D